MPLKAPSIPPLYKVDLERKFFSLHHIRVKPMEYSRSTYLRDQRVNRALSMQIVASLSFSMLAIPEAQEPMANVPASIISVINAHTGKQSPFSGSS